MEGQPASVEKTDGETKNLFVQGLRKNQNISDPFSSHLGQYYEEWFLLE